MSYFSNFVTGFQNVLTQTSSLLTSKYSIKKSIYKNSKTELLLGVDKETKEEVSIFKFNHSNDVEYKKMINNLEKRLKTIKHPNILSIKNTYESNGETTFVVEKCIPLSAFLKVSDNRKSIRYGLFVIGKALKFIHEECKLAHLKINPSSIFVSKQGDWKLSGFEISRNIDSLIDVKILQNELSVFDIENSIKDDKTIKASEVDYKQYLNLIIGLYDSPSSNFMSYNSDKVPKKLLPALKQTMDKRNKKILNISDFLKSGFFNASETEIKINVHIDNLLVYENPKKETAIEYIKENINQCATCILVNKLMPSLFDVIFNTNSKISVMCFELITYIVKSLNTTHCSNDSEESTTHSSILVANILKVLTKTTAQFPAPLGVQEHDNVDTTNKIQVLKYLGVYIVYFSEKECVSKLYPVLIKGLSSSNTLLKEHTLRSMPLFLDKLSERTINNELFHAYTRLQFDNSPAIRTNAIVSIGKIHTKLSTTNATSAIMCLLKSFSDPFVPSRVSALLAVEILHSKVASKLAVDEIMPKICPLLLDPETHVRETAFRILSSLIDKAKIVADAMPQSKLATTDHETCSNYTSENDLPTKHNSIKEQNSTKSNKENSLGSHGDSSDLEDYGDEWNIDTPIMINKNAAQPAKKEHDFKNMANPNRLKQTSQNSPQKRTPMRLGVKKKQNN